MKESVYIVDAQRTPIGKFGGSLVGTSATDLAAAVIKALLTRSPVIRRDIDEVILGNVLSAGLGQNPARIAAFRAGLAHSIPSLTINKLCGSSLKSAMLAVQAIQNDDAQVVIAGGMENMSRSPYILEAHRFGNKFGHGDVKDTLLFDGLYCSLIGEHMGVTAENIAKKYRITRELQDGYAVSSHQKAIRAIERGMFDQEIIPVEISSGKKLHIFSSDEQPRKDTSLEALSKLTPVFKKNGSVTAGNACPINDGAAALVIAGGRFVKKRALTPMAIIRGYAYVGLNPRYMGMGAYYAAKICLHHAGLNIKDVDLWEINEAFASQALAVLKLLDIDERKVNVNGGAIALGHAIGASGARILTTLLYELKRQSGRFGVASLCIGGGQGVAMLIERV